jgi:hypothetical protein
MPYLIGPNKRAKHEDRSEQQAERMKREAGDGNHRRAHLGELDTLRNPRFVVAIGEFAAEPREEEERGDQRRAGECYQYSRIGAGNFEQDDKDKRCLEEIVAESRKELTPKQRREAALRHEGRGHVSSVVGLPAVRRAPRLLDGSLDAAGGVGDAAVRAKDPPSHDLYKILI